MRIAERAAALGAAFTAAHGRPPDGIWAAPGRVNLLGEHTDYNDGFVLPVTIDREALVALARRPDGRYHCATLQQGEPATGVVADLRGQRMPGWAAYVVGVLWALGEAGCPVSGVDLLVDSDVPRGGGLSSSAALECAVAVAVTDLTGCALPRIELARVAQRAEVEVVGAPVGVMDQVASLLGRADHALLLDCRSLVVEYIALPLDAAGLRLLVFDTGVAHAHAEGGYADRRRSCEQAARLLGVPALRDATTEQVDAAAARLGPQRHRRARHVVTENTRVLTAAAELRAGSVEALPDLFAASHASLRDDLEISTPELNTAVDAARAAGALAARMTGGGFGGCALTVVPATRVELVTEAVRAAFAEAGFPPPGGFPVRPSGGAWRVV